MSHRLAFAEGERFYNAFNLVNFSEESLREGERKASEWITELQFHVHGLTALSQDEDRPARERREIRKKIKRLKEKIKWLKQRRAYYRERLQRMISISHAA